MPAFPSTGRKLLQAVAASQLLARRAVLGLLREDWLRENWLRENRLHVNRLRENRAAAAWCGAAALAFGALLLPGHAAAQTVVRPTTPGSSLFTAAAQPIARVGLVQVAAPSAYTVSASVSSQSRVAVASDLTPSPAPVAQAAAPAPPGAPAWTAPAPGAPVTNPFGVPNHEYAAGYHTGVDFAVNSGTPLRAVGDATVVSAGWDGAYGQEVVLHLPDGHFALYAHLSRLDVHAGQTVRPGQQVGLSGSTGNATGPHLHFEIRTADQYGKVIDPIAYLAAHGTGNF